jgi:NAD(P)-dependent dehydrogenase (short-subunit alcohol dehydrogenase family)
MRVEGKVAIVTGAGGPGGIGAAFARALAAEGASVILADIDSRGSTVAREITDAGGDARFAHADVSSEASTVSLAHETAGSFGRIDILVNNAALFAGQSSFPPLLETPTEVWDSMLRVNLTGTWLCCRAVVPYMAERRSGVIINMASDAGFRVRNAYGLSKLGVLGLTTALAHQLGPSGIRVNAIAPGPVWTEAQAGFDATTREATEVAMASTPLRRGGVPADLTGALLWLASDESSWVTGQAVRVDGGEVTDL